MPSQKGMNEKVNRRSINRSLLALGGLVAGGTGSVAGSDENENSERKDDEKVLNEKFTQWEEEHDGVSDVTIRKKDTDLYIQNIKYNDRTKKKIRGKQIDDNSLSFIINGNEYVMKDLTPPATRSNKKKLEPLSDQNVAESQDKTAKKKDISTKSLGPGDSETFYSADDHKYQSVGANLGSTIFDHDLSRFEGQVALDASILGYRAIGSTVFVDFEVGSGAEQIDVSYDYDYAFQHSAYGGASTTVEGIAAIRDLDAEENLSEEQLFYDSGSYAYLKTGDGSDSNITSAPIDGEGSYRFGVRAYAEVDAYSAATSTANVARQPQTDDCYLRVQDEVEIEIE